MQVQKGKYCTYPFELASYQVLSPTPTWAESQDVNRCREPVGEILPGAFHERLLRIAASNISSASSISSLQTVIGGAMRKIPKPPRTTLVIMPSSRQVRATR